LDDTDAASVRNTLGLGTAATTASSAYATAAQGALADTATQPADLSTAIDALVSAAPGTLDTLNELAAALGNDPNFAATITNSIATKLAKAGGTMTGDIDFGDNKAKNVTLENFQETIVADATLPSSVTIPDTGNIARYTLTGNATITLPKTDEMPASTTRAVTVIVKQDGTGARTLTLSPPAGYTILWNNADSQPAVNPDAGKTTIYTATYIKGDTNIYVSLSFYEG